MILLRFTNPRAFIQAWLARQGQIAIIWSIEDVQQQRPDLDAASAWKVLQACREAHDCEIGFTWTLIDCVAESLYPVEQD